MADINATFKNTYGESRHYTVWDLGRDPNQPPVIFDGYLDAGQVTDTIALHGDGSYGRVKYQRSDSEGRTTDVSDGATVDLD